MVYVNRSINANLLVNLSQRLLTLILKLSEGSYLIQ